MEDTGAIVVARTALVVCSLRAATMLAAKKRNGNTPHGLNSISETDTDNSTGIALCVQNSKPMI